MPEKIGWIAEQAAAANTGRGGSRYDNGLQNKVSKL
jgi:hypothetical protein